MHFQNSEKVSTLLAHAFHNKFPACSLHRLFNAKDRAGKLWIPNF